MGREQEIETLSIVCGITKTQADKVLLAGYRLTSKPEPVDGGSTYSYCLPCLKCGYDPNTESIITSICKQVAPDEKLREEIAEWLYKDYSQVELGLNPEVWGEYAGLAEKYKQEWRFKANSILKLVQQSHEDWETKARDNGWVQLDEDQTLPDDSDYDQYVTKEWSNVMLRANFRRIKQEG